MTFRPLKKAMSVIVALVSFSAMASNSLNIIPQPQHVVADSQQVFQIGGDMRIFAEGQEARKSAQYLLHYCARYLGMHLSLTDNAAQAAITISYTPNKADTTPRYTLSVDKSGIDIAGEGAPEAAFYGVQTLIQLLPTRAGAIPRIPLCTITDTPRFGYRAMHLDVVRHFFPVSFVKQYIDWLALHKFNYFHWHLTDDQGWRIQLKSHPELTDKGAYRAGEIKGLFPGEYHDLPYEAFYTQEQIEEVIAYAADRYITVIPEIDIPGHCMAVLAAHPEFSTTPQESKHTALTWGIFNRQNNVLAPSDSVFRFLNEVFAEVCQLFPGKYIHAGGDECASKWWNECEATQTYMNEHGIADAKALQTYFMQHVMRVAQRYGKTLIGWDGGIEGLNPSQCVVESWHMRPTMPQHLINSTHKWINATGRAHYFDYHEDSTQTEVMAGQGRITLSVRQVLEYPLVPDSASQEVKKNLIGVEGCCWTEYVPSTWKCEYLVFPRLAALAEKAWSAPSQRSKDEAWTDFYRRLLTQLCRYDLWGIRYNPSVEKNSAHQRQR